ncbi:MAG: hypothetical protein M3Y24_10230, partial [Acidobacteriota bacterium]|nr:hypothetical protein [Acidobacteriota bacterium]
AYKAAVERGGAAAALGYEGLGSLAKLEGENPKVYWDDAIRSGSRSATVYVAAAQDLPAAEALPLLKRAAQLNERWSEPIYRQAQLAQDPADKESLLKAAIKLDPRATNIWVELAQLQTDSGEATASQGSWLRAEESAPSDAERDRVRQLRLSSEQRRLDAAEERERRERDAPYFADLRAQKAEENRIHAAEQKANQSLDAAAGDSKPSDVVQWNSLVQGKKLSGTLTRVDCLKSGWRLSVKDKSGKQTVLFLSKESHADLPCGLQAKPRRLTVEYHAAPDDDLHTEGEITSLRLQ